MHCIISDGTDPGYPCSDSCEGDFECIDGVCVCPAGEVEVENDCCEFCLAKQ